MDKFILDEREGPDFLLWLALKEKRWLIVNSSRSDRFMLNACLSNGRATAACEKYIYSKLEIRLSLAKRKEYILHCRISIMVTALYSGS